jgi:methylase of polypeptide subunit release factors
VSPFGIDHSTRRPLDVKRRVYVPRVETVALVHSFTTSPYPNETFTPRP